MDDIEITLDVIKDSTLKTQADVDRLMRDFSKPDSNKQILAGLGGGGGFMDSLVKAITGGKGAGGIMGAGIAGGMAAGGIMALVDILKDAVSHSKILTTVLGTIMNALGLLIDVILLPFLPVIMTGIIWLYQGIMIFYKFWSGIWNGKTFQNIEAALVSIGAQLAKGIVGLLSIGVSLLSGAAGAAWDFLQWVWQVSTGVAKAILSLDFNILGTIYNFLVWLWQVSTGVAKAILSLDFNILGTIYNFLVWLWDVTSGIRNAELSLAVSIAGAAVNFLMWLYNTIASGGANLVVNITSGVSNAVSSAVSGARSWLSGAESWLGNLLHFDQGGVVPGSGAQLAVVHGGETVTPAGQGSGSTYHFHFDNYVGSKTELMKVVTDSLRQQQYRYQA